VSALLAWPSLRARRIAAALVLAGWLVSFALPAAYLDGFALMGYALLFFGPLGVGELQFGWFANPLLLFSLVLLTRPHPNRRLRATCATLLLLTGASALTWRTWPDIDVNVDRTLPLTAYGPGYPLWLALVLGTAIAMLFLAFRDPTE
jgi:hypothetical protein